MFMKKIQEFFKNVDKGAFFRILTLAVVLLNQAVAVFGATSFATAPWYQVLSIVATVVASVVAAIKRNDLTYFSKLASGLIDALKDGKIEEGEITSLMEKLDATEETPKE